MRRVAILAGGTGWHVRDLLRAARDRGVSAEAVDFRSLAAGVGTAPGPLAGCDAVIVRTMPAGSLEQVVFRMDVLHAAAGAGVRVLNPPRALETCVDKYLTSVRLAAAGLPTPPTHAAQRADDALQAFARLGGDVVLKPVFGSEGRGLQRISDPDLAWRTFRVLQNSGQLIYQQQFVPHPGYDYRLLVVGGRVHAAMRRHGTDWRTNVARGGRADPLRPGDELAALAVRAAAAVGCPVAGVDLLPGPRGEVYVIEVNAVPGWKALSAVCGLDIAAEVLRFLIEEYRP